jgi:hypothetical protein
MTLCDEGHDEVCYEGRNCPACEYRVKYENCQESLDQASELIDDLKQELRERQ